MSNFKMSAYLCIANWLIASINILITIEIERGGKSGQHRVTYFLTGRREINFLTDSATENKPLRRSPDFYQDRRWSKGEKVIMIYHGLVMVTFPRVRAHQYGW